MRQQISRGCAIFLAEAHTGVKCEACVRAKCFVTLCPFLANMRAHTNISMLAHCVNSTQDQEERRSTRSRGRERSGRDKGKDDAPNKGADGKGQGAKEQDGGEGATSSTPTEAAPAQEAVLPASGSKRAAEETEELAGSGTAKRANTEGGGGKSADGGVHGERGRMRGRVRVHVICGWAGFGGLKHTCGCACLLTQHPFMGVLYACVCRSAQAHAS